MLLYEQDETCPTARPKFNCFLIELHSSKTLQTQQERENYFWYVRTFLLLISSLLSKREQHLRELTVYISSYVNKQGSLMLEIIFQLLLFWIIYMTSATYMTYSNQSRERTLLCLFLTVAAAVTGCIVYHFLLCTLHFVCSYKLDRSK